MAKQLTTEGVKWVPMVAQNYAYGTEKGSTENPLVKRLFLLPVRMALLSYFDIPYPTTTEGLAAFKKAQGKSLSLFKAVSAHSRKKFSGFDDTTGSETSLEDNEIGNPLSMIRKLGHKVVIKTPSRTYINTKGKTVTRSAEFLFPKELTMLQVAQAMGSLLQQADGDKYADTFKIIGHGKYPLIPHSDKGPLNSAKVGCWVVTAVPTDLSPNLPNRRGDDAIESPLLTSHQIDQ